MNYKEKNLRALMLALVAVLLTGFTSCSKSDDNNGDNTTKENTVPVAAIVKFAYTATQEELSICDVIAEYTDADGKNQSEAITTTSWTKSITYSSLPANGTISIKRTLKENAELTQDEYNFTKESPIQEVELYNSEKVKIATEKLRSYSRASYTLGKDDLAEFLEHYDFSYSYTLDTKMNSEGIHFSVTQKKNN